MIPAPTLRFIVDGGHGWLELPAAEVDRLGLRETVSHFSYVSRDGHFAYLEEDCDFDRYVKAKIARGEAWEGTWRDEVHRGDAFVRELPPYEPARLSVSHP